MSNSSYVSFRECCFTSNLTISFKFSTPWPYIIYNFLFSLHCLWGLVVMSHLSSLIYWFCAFSPPIPGISMNLPSFIHFISLLKSTFSFTIISIINLFSISLLLAHVLCLTFPLISKCINRSNAIIFPKIKL